MLINLLRHHEESEERKDYGEFKEIQNNLSNEE